MVASFPLTGLQGLAIFEGLDLGLPPALLPNPTHLLGGYASFSLPLHQGQGQAAPSLAIFLPLGLLSQGIRRGRFVLTPVCPPQNFLYTPTPPWLP